MRVLGLGLAAFVLVTGSNAFAACGTGKVVFSDTFDSGLAKVWGDPDKWMSAKGGQMVLAESDGNFYTAWADPLFRNVDFCADVVLNDTSDKTFAEAYGGIVFWMRDTDHFYTLQITLDGYAAVYKYDGDWTSLIDDTKFDAIKLGKGAINSLRVVTHSGNATLYVNGKMFDEVDEKGTPGTSHVGLIVEAPADNGTASFAFDNVAVHETVFQASY